MIGGYLRAERGLNVVKPPCRMGCGRKAYGPRGLCHRCYDIALRELNAWRRKMALRRQGNGVI
jgi:hypothetical protein